MTSAGGVTGPSSRIPRSIWILAVMNFFVAVGFGVMSPVLPTYVRAFHVSTFLVGLVVSSLAVVRLMTNPAASWIMRRIGPRQLVFVGSLLISATTFMMGVSGSYAEILLWRGLSGLGSACHGVGSLALVFLFAPTHLRGRVNALTGGGWVIGGMAGPALGGLVVQISVHAPFFFYAATLLAGAIIVWFFIPRTPRSGWTQAAAGYPLLGLVRDRRFRAACAVNFANSWQSFGARTLLIPLFVSEVLLRSESWTGWALTIAALAQFACLAPSGQAADRIGRKPTLLFGLVMCASVSACLALSDSYAVLVALMCLYSVGNSAMGATSQALLADVVPPQAGKGLAVYQMCGDLGTITGPLVAGALIDFLPMTVAWCVGAGFLALAAVLVATMGSGPVVQAEAPAA